MCVDQITLNNKQVFVVFVIQIKKKSIEQ